MFYVIIMQIITFYVIIMQILTFHVIIMQILTFYVIIMQILTFYPQTHPKVYQIYIQNSFIIRNNTH